MLRNEDRKQILVSFLETIEGLSNKEYQKRVWIRGEGPECDDFTETTCHFLEEGDAILEEYKDFEINKKQYNLLIKLRNQFNKFVKGPRKGYLPEEFIDTPEWARIMEMAKEVLEAFNYQSKNENVNKNIEFFIDELSSAVNEKVLNQSKEISWPMVFQESTVSIQKLIDNCEIVLSRKEDFQLEEKQYALIKELYNLLLDFSKEYYDIPEEKEKNPKWKKIVEVGRKILKTFRS